jgi:SAM-dependent methyltransferase
MGNSGSGSYGRLAMFKAEFLNEFISKRGVATILELGCGDGAQLELANYPGYVGVDVSQTAIDVCRGRFSDVLEYRFFYSDERNAYRNAYDLSLSLDAIYHLVEDEVFESYMNDLFGFSRRFVIIYSSDNERAYAGSHVRHRRFGQYVAARFPQWKLIERVPNKYPFDPLDEDNTSFCDFFVYEMVSV